MKSIVNKIILIALGSIFCLLYGFQPENITAPLKNKTQIYKDSVYSTDTTFMYDSTTAYNVVISKFPVRKPSVVKITNGDTSLYYDNSIVISILKNGAAFSQILLTRNDFAGKVFPYHVNEFLLTFAKYDSVSKNGIFINLELTKLDRSRIAVFQAMVYFNGQSSIWRMGIVRSFGTSTKNQTEITQSFKLKINKNLSPFAFNININTENDAVNRIFVYKGKDKDFVQSIVIPDSEKVNPPYKDLAYFSSKDFNFDGYGDIMLLKYMGAAGNKSYLIWLYDTTSRKFVFNSRLSSLGLPGVIPEKKEVDSFKRSGHGNYKYGYYKWINRRLTIVKEITYKCKDSITATRTETARLNGKMIVVSERKVNCGDDEDQNKQKIE